jgi:hypothetical protein
MKERMAYAVIVKRVATFGETDQAAGGQMDLRTEKRNRC